jgi:hypothetical protein
MFTECSLNVHGMFTECPLSARGGRSMAVCEERVARGVERPQDDLPQASVCINDDDNQPVWPTWAMGALF